MKIRDEDLIQTWADRPDAFALEPKHVQDKHREAVEAARSRTSEKGAGEKPVPTRRK